MSGPNPSGGLRVLLVTQYYHPEVGAAQTRLRETTAGLRRRGFEVTVVAPVPSYPLGIVPKPYAWWRPARERIDGVRVARMPTIALPGVLDPTINRGEQNERPRLRPADSESTGTSRPESAGPRNGGATDEKGRSSSDIPKLWLAGLEQSEPKPTESQSQDRQAETSPGEAERSNTESKSRRRSEPGALAWHLSRRPLTAERPERWRRSH